ncbi:hypothetical protein [Spongorhabdus nitratireducens]
MEALTSFFLTPLGWAVGAVLFCAWVWIAWIAGEYSDKHWGAPESGTLIIFGLTGVFALLGYWLM